MVILTLLYLHPYDSIVKTKQRRNVRKQTTFSLELTANATWTRRRSDEYIYIFVLLTPPMSPYCLSFSVLLNLLLEQRNIEPIWFRIPCWRLATSSWTESVNALHHTTARSIIRSDFFSQNRGTFPTSSYVTPYAHSAVNVSERSITAHPKQMKRPNKSGLNESARGLPLLMCQRKPTSSITRWEPQIHSHPDGLWWINKAQRSLMAPLIRSHRCLPSSFFLL